MGMSGQITRLDSYGDRYDSGYDNELIRRGSYSEAEDMKEGIKEDGDDTCTKMRDLGVTKAEKQKWKAKEEKGKKQDGVVEGESRGMIELMAGKAVVKTKNTNGKEKEGDGTKHNIQEPEGTTDKSIDWY